MIEEEKVKCLSKKKYTCKRNKGEHEWLTPTIKYGPEVEYLFKHKVGILYSHTLYPEPITDYKFMRAEVKIMLETTCKHCGHKDITFFTEKIK